MREESASLTAAMIATVAVVCAREPNLAGLVPPEAARLAKVFIDGLTARWPMAPYRGMSLPGVRALSFLWDQALYGGFQVHFMLRKAYIEAATREAVSAGARQVIVIGAGFDSLALRLAREMPRLRCLEIDHPASQRVKLRLLERAGERLPPNFSAVAADLATRPLAEVLGEQVAFVATEPAVFIAEGLLMYLPDAAVRSLFTTIRQAATGGAVFAFSHMEHPRHHRSMALLLRRIGEPFLWGIDPAELPTMLEGLGYRIEQSAGSDELRALFLPKTARPWHQSETPERVTVARTT